MGRDMDAHAARGAARAGGRSWGPITGMAARVPWGPSGVFSQAAHARQRTLASATGEATVASATCICTLGRLMAARLDGMGPLAWKAEAVARKPTQTERTAGITRLRGWARRQTRVSARAVASRGPQANAGAPVPGAVGAGSEGGS